MSTKIEWCQNPDGTRGETWNPITGCGPFGVSTGCKNCYARKMAKRLAGRFGYDKDGPFKATLHENKFFQPLKWKKPRMIFTCSMGDLFYENVWDFWTDRVMAVISLCPQHTFQILTKRPERMREYFATHGCMVGGVCFSLSNLWLGVSAENQAAADERIPHLLQTPAAVRFVSLEPLLGPIDTTRVSAGLLCPQRPGHTVDVLRGGTWDARSGMTNIAPEFINHSDMKTIDWVIVGCESGPRRRECKIEWVEDIVRQCDEADVPCFVKQLSINGKVSKDPAEWPEHLRVRQFPEVRR